MKKWVAWIGILGVFGLTGCGTVILKKPAVLSVKKMAIVSVYANAQLHDVEAEAKEASNASMLGALVGSLGGLEKKIDTDEPTLLVTSGLKTFGEQLSAIPQWKLIPPQEVINNQKYKQLMKSDQPGAMGDFLSALGKAATSTWVTPPGMPYIPASSLTQGSSSYTVYAGDAKDPVVEAKTNLASLCKDLNVDAVAVIGLDLAYKKGWLSGMSGTGIFSGVLGSATPSVRAEMVVVTKDAQIAVETPLLGQGSSFPYSEGKEAPMLKKGEPYLKDSKKEAINSYADAIAKSAISLKDMIIKELEK